MADETPVKIKTSIRWLVGIVGLAAFIAGAVAVFTTENGVGSAALIAVGALLLLVAAIGYVRSISVPGGGGAVFGVPADEIAGDLDVLGDNVETLAIDAKAKGKVELAGVATEASSGIGKLSKSVSHSTDAVIAPKALKASDVRHIGQVAALDLSRLLGTWVTSEATDPPHHVEFEVFVSQSGLRWDMVLKWSQPELFLYLDVKVVLRADEPGRMAMIGRRSIERAALEIISKSEDEPPKEALIVFVVPDVSEIDVARPRALRLDYRGINSVLWNGSSDAPIRKIEEIRRRFVEKSDQHGNDPVS